jgi:hypothetical protein
VVGGTFNGAPATLPVLPRPAPRTPHMLARVSVLKRLAGAEGWGRLRGAQRGVRVVLW